MFQLAEIISQLVVAFTVGQMKLFHTSKFKLKLFDLFDREMGELGLRFAAKNLADKKRENTAMRKHGLVHDLDLQSVAQQPVASTVSSSTADTTPLYSPRQSDQNPTASASTQLVPTATVAPTVTYVQAAPAPVYYYAQPYYYPSYAWFPPVSLSFAWGSGWHGGYYGGWHGGSYGGWHH